LRLGLSVLARCRSQLTLEKTYKGFCLRRKVWVLCLLWTDSFYFLPNFVSLKLGASAGTPTERKDMNSAGFRTSTSFFSGEGLLVLPSADPTPSLQALLGLGSPACHCSILASIPVDVLFSGKRSPSQDSASTTLLCISAILYFILGLLLPLRFRHACFLFSLPGKEPVLLLRMRIKGCLRFYYERYCLLLNSALFLGPVVLGCWDILCMDFLVLPLSAWDWTHTILDSVRFFTIFLWEHL